MQLKNSLTMTVTTDEQRIQPIFPGACAIISSGCKRAPKCTPVQNCQWLASLFVDRQAAHDKNSRKLQARSPSVRNP
jgi:hypothetical protein